MKPGILSSNAVKPHLSTSERLVLEDGGGRKYVKKVITSVLSDKRWLRENVGWRPQRARGQRTGWYLNSFGGVLALLSHK